MNHTHHDQPSAEPRQITHTPSAEERPKAPRLTPNDVRAIIRAIDRAREAEAYAERAVKERSPDAESALKAFFDAMLSLEALEIRFMSREERLDLWEQAGR